MTTASAPIGRFPIPEIQDLPDDIRERILAVQEKAGFVPNVFLVLAYRPDEFRSFFAYHDALMEREGNLTKAEREMIVVATSSANQCQYCVVAHGAILRIRAKNPFVTDQVAANYRKADITSRQKAMLDFAMKVSSQAYAVDEHDFETLKQHGFDMDDVWISLPSVRSSACRTVWRTSRACGRTMSSTAWAASPCLSTRAVQLVPGISRKGNPTAAVIPGPRSQAASVSSNSTRVTRLLTGLLIS